ncbi:MAG: hypothetical protein ABFD09_12675 [Proteiniphilum sp.]
MNIQKKLSRRDFLITSSLGALGAGFYTSKLFGSGFNSFSNDFNQTRFYQPMVITGKELVIQPVLRHRLEKYQAQTSWRNWGDVHTEEAASQEVQRITQELERMKEKANFPVKILPVKRAMSHEEGEKIKQEKNYDLMLLYAAGAEYDKGLDPCIPEDRLCLIFVRHKNGPMYDWYENASNRFLRVGGKNFEIDSHRYFHGMGPDDVIVDDYDEMLWKIRAIYGLHNFFGKKIVALGGASGKLTSMAPEIARTKFIFDIIEIGYDDLGKRLDTALKDSKMGQKVQDMMSQYLKIPNTKIDTKTDFIKNAFYLYFIFKNYLSENNATAFTINNCMGTIMNVSQTTACLTLSMLNDEGYLAFCESDFVVIPSGILLHYISGTPVFMHNPAYPDKNNVTCAHCTSPRRMDGKGYEPADLVTHYESDYGAAIKVDMKIGQKVTLIDPDAEQKRWLGIEGSVIENPHLPACRSQQEIKFVGDTSRLRSEIRGSHWMMTYGTWTNEMGYACRKMGVDWLNISI